MSINIRKLITQSYALAQLISQDFDDELDGVRADAAVQQLNNIIAQLNSSAVFPFTRTQTNFAVPTSKMNYTMGIDNESAIPIVADIAADRPEFIEKMYYKSSSNSAPYEIRQIDFKDVGLYAQSRISIGMPCVFSMDNAYPLTNVTFNIMPSAGSVIQIVYTASIPEVNINTDMVIPSKYNSVLVPALARHLAVNQPSELLANIDSLYKENLRQLKSANLRSRIPSSTRNFDSIDAKMSRFNSGYN